MYGNLAKKGTFLAQDIQDALPGSQKNPKERQSKQQFAACPPLGAEAPPQEHGA